MKTTLRRKPRKTFGFSLVEIVVAVGIVATVMVALVGMIPTGLNTVNEAAHTMAEIRIAQQILGEVQLTEWKEIDKWEAEGPYYYDLEGNKLDGDDVSKTVYTCQVEVEEAAPLPQAEANEYLKRVTVKVSNKRGAKVNFSDTAPRKEYRQFSGNSVLTRSDEEIRGF